MEDSFEQKRRKEMVVLRSVTTAEIVIYAVTIVEFLRLMKGPYLMSPDGTIAISTFLYITMLLGIIVIPGPLFSLRSIGDYCDYGSFDNSFIGRLVRKLDENLVIAEGCCKRIIVKE